MRIATAGDLGSVVGQGEPFRVQHDLTDHPLLTVESVARLAGRLPERSVDHNLGRVPALLPGGNAPRSTEPLRDLARLPDVGGSWIAMLNIEQDPAYAVLLDEVLDAVSAALGGLSTRRGRAGFLFLSASGSVTPAHIDAEENVLLQIRGTKTVAVASFPSPELRGVEVERFHGGGHRNVDRLPSEPREVSLEPGAGVYIPLYAPHWVSVGPELSISLSVTWRPHEVDRAKAVARVNKWLRRGGASPRPPGLSLWADHGKYAAAHVAGPLVHMVKAAGRRSDGS
jgi:hypothetical protein